MTQPRRFNVPLYTQIAGSIRAEIEAGQWPVGSRLPSIDQLAERFGVALQTMRQALIVLEENDLVIRKQGRGTFVLSTALDQRWLVLPTDWNSLVGMMERLEARMTLVSVSDRMPHFRANEGQPAKAYKFMKRVHFRDDRPFCVIDIYLEAELYMKKPRAFREKVVVPILSRMDDVKISQVLQSIRIDVADRDNAKLLDIPIAGPVARVRRSITDSEGVVIYVADIVYRGDVVQLEMNLSPDYLPTAI